MPEENTDASGSAILWTGATGFFGRALLRFLKANGTGGAVFHLLSRNPETFARHWPELAEIPNTFWHRGDIMSLSRSDIPPLTHVVHAAADSTYGASLTKMERFDQIVEGTRQVLDLSVSRGATRILFASSGGVYGRQPSELYAIPEDYVGMPDPLSPEQVYGVAKRTAEHLCALYAEKYGLEIVIARCFAFAGQDLPLDVHFAIGNFIRDALWENEIIVKGNGTAVRSYLDQRDLARWMLRLMTKGRSGEAYNVGSNRAISIGELAHLVRNLVSPKKSVCILGERIDGVERHRYLPDIRKINLEFGLRPSVSLEQSLIEMARSVRTPANYDK